MSFHQPADASMTDHPQTHPEADPPASPAGARRASWTAAVVVTLLAAVVPAVLWAGDVSWIQDEPRLLAKAFHANARGALESHGLNGNFGVPYGPLPTHIYQLLLLITHDPVTLAGMRAGACAGVTALGLLWLARALRLNPWFATAVVLAPYVWNFQRILWDASFAVPIGTRRAGGVRGVSAYGQRRPPAHRASAAPPPWPSSTRRTYRSCSRSPPTRCGAGGRQSRGTTSASPSCSA
jgi:hypothetical protein